MWLTIIIKNVIYIADKNNAQFILKYLCVINWGELKQQIRNEMNNKYVVLETSQRL